MSAAALLWALCGCDDTPGSPPFEVIAGAGSASGTTSGSEAGITSGAEAGATSGAEAGATSGAEAGATSGTTSGAEAGSTSGAEAGATSGAEAGATSGAEAGAQATALIEARFEVSVSYQDRVYGAWGYEGAHEQRVAPSIALSLVDEGAWARGDEGAELLSALTDAEGRASLELSVERGRRLKLIAWARLNEGGHLAEVKDRDAAGSLYALEGEPFEVSAQQSVSLEAPAESALAGALNILEATRRGFRQLIAHGVSPSAPLTYRWRMGEAFSCGSCYQNNTISLGGQVEDTDQYDDHIILHEMGHFMVDKWSLDTSPGGPHRSRRVGSSLAYGEGVAYFWSALVLSDPLVVDWMEPTAWVSDLESGELNGALMPMNVDVLGFQHEEVVSSYLWDAYDDEQDSLGGELDVVSLSEGEVMNILLTHLPQRSVEYVYNGVDLGDWIEAALCEAPGEVEGLWSLARARRYPWAPAQVGFDLTTGAPIEGGACSGKGASPYQLMERDGGLWLEPRARELTAPLTLELKEGTPPAAAPLGEQRRCEALPCELLSPSAFKEASELTRPLLFQAPTFTLSWLSPKAHRALLTREGRDTFTQRRFKGEAVLLQRSFTSNIKND